MKKAFIIAALLFGVSIIQAKIINVPIDHGTIRAAVGSASPGDTLLLAPGTYTQPKLININKAITIASKYIFTNNEADINNTIINAASNEMGEWFELSAKNSKVIGIKFQGNDEHTLNITASWASVTFCKFIGGKDQLSVSGGGGYIGYNYFEGGGDDGIDCDNSIDWTIEYNTIVNSYQDGIEIRLHDKGAPLTTHIFRHNTVIGAGQSGIQIIDYQGNSYRKFYVHNNIFQDCKGAGFSCMYQEKDNTNEVYRGSLMQEPAFVYNNTFDGCNYGLTTSPGLMVLNNIFTNSGTMGIERGEYVNDANDLSIVDYCLFYNNPVHFDADISLGANNILDVDPKLDEQFNPDSNDDCVDTGCAEYKWKNKKLSIPKDNFVGNAPDIGAREFGAPGLQTVHPTISAGQDIILIAPEKRALLAGSVKGVDAENQMNISWSKISGPGKVKFSSPYQLETSVMFSEQGIYELALIASNSHFTTSDKLNVSFVNDFSDRSVSVGSGKDIYVEAEDYRFIVGRALIETNSKTSDKTVKFNKDDGLLGFAQYQISTKSAGTYYVWIRLKGKTDQINDLAVSFNHLQNEVPIKVTQLKKPNTFNWHRIAFAKVPEGIYPLRIRAVQQGVEWDKIYITYDESKKPLN
jgi:hypothetical protein